MPQPARPPIIVFWRGERDPAVFGSTEAALLFVGNDLEVVEGSQVFDADGRKLEFAFETKRGVLRRSVHRLKGLSAVGSSPELLEERLRSSLELGLDLGLDQLVALALERYLVD